MKQPSLMQRLILLGALVIGFYMVKNMTDPRDWDAFWDYMLGDWWDFYAVHLEGRLPGLDNPLVMLVIATVVLMLIFRRRN